MTEFESPAGWLAAPITTLFSDPDGNTEAAYVQFRDGPVVRVEKPDPDYPVYLYIGADDLPVGVKLTAPISGILETTIKPRIVAASDGAPRMERRVAHSFTPTTGPSSEDRVRAAMRQVETASRNLERASA